MNIQKIEYYIQKYKENFERVHEQEIDKWKAVKCFKENWDINASDFPKMLDDSLALTKNLLDSEQYFPKRMLINNSIIDPEPIRKLLAYLLDEDTDLLERIEIFRKKFKEINDKNFEGRNDYQDHRAILVYLSLVYPDKYFLYKFSMFKDFAQRIGFSYRPVKGRIENIGQYQSLCKLIRYELLKDQELLKLHKERISKDCYFDKSYNILTQDFIYAVVTHLKEEETQIEEKISTQGKVENIGLENVSIPDSKISFKPSMTNHIQREIDNKRIGDLGELWVVDYEKQRLIDLGKNKLADRVEHIAKEKGDGTGLDIKSFDKNSQEIFIEVKTTTGGLSTPFYITRNELERSIIEKDKYFLYRLYNYNDKDNEGDLAIINGELTEYCKFASTFKVKIKNEK